jgi:hypothetical protein
VVDSCICRGERARLVSISAGRIGAVLNNRTFTVLISAHPSSSSPPLAGAAVGIDPSPALGVFVFVLDFEVLPDFSNGGCDLVMVISTGAPGACDMLGATVGELLDGLFGNEVGVEAV